VVAERTGNTRGTGKRLQMPILRDTHQEHGAFDSGERDVAREKGHYGAAVALPTGSRRLVADDRARVAVARASGAASLRPYSTATAGHLKPRRLLPPVKRSLCWSGDNHVLSPAA